MAARPRTLPAAIAPVLVGTAAARRWAGRLSRSGAFIAALVGSSSSRSGPTSPTTTPTRSGVPTPPTGSGRCGCRPRAGRAAAGPVRPGWPSGSRSPAVSTWPTVAGFVILLSAPPGSPPACSTPAARGPTATRAWARSSSSCSSGSSPSTAPTTSRSSSSTALPFGLSLAVGFLATAILVVNNCATSTPTAAPASGRSPCGSAATARAASTAAGLGAFVALPSPWSPAAPLVGRCSASLALPLAVRPPRALIEPHRRAGAQRRPGRHRRAAWRLQPAVSLGLLIAA